MRIVVGVVVLCAISLAATAARAEHQADEVALPVRLIGCAVDAEKCVLLGRFATQEICSRFVRQAMIEVPCPPADLSRLPKSERFRIGSLSSGNPVLAQNAIDKIAWDQCQQLRASGKFPGGPNLLCEADASAK